MFRRIIYSVLGVGVLFCILCADLYAITVSLSVNQHYQEKTNWCWNASSQAILEYYGINKSQTTIAAYGTPGLENSTNFLYGSDSARNGIDLILNHFGWVPTSPYSRALSKSEVEAELSSGWPFAFAWNWDSGGGHALVVRGIDGDTLDIMDPWDGQRLVSYSWTVKGGGHTWAYTLTTSDPPPPNPPESLSANPDSFTTNNSFAVDWTNPVDPYGIANIYYYKRGSAPTSNGDYEGYKTSKPFTVSASAQNGQKIYVWLEDSSGRKSYLNSQYTWLNYRVNTNDGVAPTGSISISGGAGETTSLTVPLTLSASDNMGSGAQMRFGVVNWCTAVPYSTSNNFDLSSCGGNTDEGSKIVYVQFIDADGKWSPVYSDTIDYKPATPGNDSCASSALPSGAKSATIWIDDVPPYGDAFVYNYGTDANKNYYTAFFGPSRGASRSMARGISDQAEGRLGACRGCHGQA